MTVARKWERWISICYYGLIAFFTASLFVHVSHRMFLSSLAVFAILLVLEVFARSSERPRWARLTSVMLVVGLLAFLSEINHFSEPVIHWATWAFLGVFVVVRIVEDPTAWWAGEMAKRDTGQHQGK